MLPEPRPSPPPFKIYERNKKISFLFNVLTLTPPPDQHRPCLFHSVVGGGKEKNTYTHRELHFEWGTCKSYTYLNLRINSIIGAPPTPRGPPYPPSTNPHVKSTIRFKFLILLCALASLLFFNVSGEYSIVPILVPLVKSRRRGKGQPHPYIRVLPGPGRRSK